MMEERRRHQRLVPDLPLFVRVEGAKRSPVLDLSEGGLSFGGIIQSNVFSMTLDLPDGNGAIQAQGEVAWTSNSRATTGVRFVQLAENCRQRLKNWISSRAFLPGEEVVEIRPSQPLQVIAGGALREASASDASGLQLRATSRRRVIEILLSAIVLCSAFVCIGYYLPNLAGRSNAGNETSISQATPSAVTSTREPSPPVTTIATHPKSLPARMPLDIAGYVIQVGAMTHEDNADALAVVLQRKSFPAFVFRRTGDHFYRVAVGPYSDENSTMRVKEQIEKEGFETILRNWAPE